MKKLNWFLIGLVLIASIAFMGCKDDGVTPAPVVPDPLTFEEIAYGNVFQIAGVDGIYVAMQDGFSVVYWDCDGNEVLEPWEELRVVDTVLAGDELTLDPDGINLVTLVGLADPDFTLTGTFNGDIFDVEDTGLESTIYFNAVDVTIIDLAGEAWDWSPGAPRDAGDWIVTADETIVAEHNNQGATWTEMFGQDFMPVDDQYFKLSYEYRNEFSSGDADHVITLHTDLYGDVPINVSDGNIPSAKAFSFESWHEVEILVYPPSEPCDSFTVKLYKDGRRLDSEEFPDLWYINGFTLSHDNDFSSFRMTEFKDFSAQIADPK